MGAGGGRATLRDQRAELRALQDLRYQGPESEYYLGSARRRRRTELPEYVIVPVTMLPYQGFQYGRSGPVGAHPCGPGPNRPFSRARHAAAPRAIVRQMELIQP